jgi:hypothetical protein
LEAVGINTLLSKYYITRQILASFFWLQLFAYNLQSIKKTAMLIKTVAVFQQIELVKIIFKN